MLQTVFRPCFCYAEKTILVNENREESGLDRVKRMYESSNYGLMSPELFFLLRNVTFSVGTAAFFGALINASKVRQDYLRRNVASRFESQHLARRSLTDTITLSAFKGAFTYGLKYGSFSSAYLMSTMTIATYNNKITIWEHIGTGALLGAIVRVNFGLKGMIASASVGSFLGAFAGGIIVLFMKLNNLTLEDIRKMETEKYYSDLKKSIQAKSEKTDKYS